jgi:hypothetical protein
LRFIPRLSIYLGHVCATNTFNHEWPLGDVLRRVRTIPRFAITLAGDWLEVGAPSFCHNCLTTSGAYTHPAIFYAVARKRL